MYTDHSPGKVQNKISLAAVTVALQDVTAQGKGHRRTAQHKFYKYKSSQTHTGSIDHKILIWEGEMLVSCASSTFALLLMCNHERYLRGVSSKAVNHETVSSQGLPAARLVSSAPEHLWVGQPRAWQWCHTWPSPVHGSV